MSARQREQNGFLDKPMSIYEVHLGSWARGPTARTFLSYRELADRLVPYAQEMGFTHIELLPIMEHPFAGVVGLPGDRLLRPELALRPPRGLQGVCGRVPPAGIGVLLDWVPGTSRRTNTAWRFDGTALYEHEDPRQGEHQDWGTLIFNYGRHEVRSFLLSNALFWLEEYHIDGLRVDAVASMLYLDYSREEGEWVPNRYGGRENLDAIDFLREMNSLVHGRSIRGR
jgi:1,4-alpha-glucan branching enzyme